MKTPFFTFFVFFSLTSLFGQEVNTDGNNSPAVIAENFSVTYGVRADAIEAILWIYETEGYDVERRKRATEQILKEYAQSPEKKQKASELTEASRNKMGISDAPKITNALEWDLFARNHYLSTTGQNSPAVVAKGDVSIWYGISPKALRSLAAQLEKNKTELNDFDRKLAEQAKKYEELKIELGTYGSKEEIYRQAERLLEEGNLERAEQLIESDFEASMKRQAYKSYIYGKTKELLLKYGEAAKGYKNAVSNDESNSTYHRNYAYNEARLAHYNEAIKHFEIALGIDSLKNGTEEDVATLLNDIGLALSSIGKYDEAIGYYKNALNVNWLNIQKPTRLITSICNNIGLAWYEKEQYDTAIYHYEMALNMLQLGFGEKNQYGATTYNNLGGAWNNKGNYDKALIYYDKALQIFLKELGEVHPDVAICYNNIGGTYFEKDDFDKAMFYFDKALQVDVIVFGENHPNVALRYSNLGMIWEENKEYDKAIEYFNKALKILLLFFDEDHKNVLNQYYHISSSFYEKGEYDKAIEYYEKVLKIDLQVLGESHPTVLLGYYYLGNIYNDNREFNKAMTYYENCQKIIQESIEPTQLDQITVANNLSQVANRRGMELYNEKNFIEALGCFQKALKNAQTAKDTAQTITCWNNIGSMQKHLKQYEAGLLSIEKGLHLAAQLNEAIDKEIKKRLTSEQLIMPEVQKKIAEIKNSVLIRRMLYHKVGCLKGMGKNKEAEALAKKIWQEGKDTDDTRLLEDLKNDGYDFDKN